MGRSGVEWNPKPRPKRRIVDVAPTPEWARKKLAKTKKKKKIVREPRPRPTQMETLLAKDLRQIEVRFWQQQKIGPYSVDFLVHPKLVIEVDGSVHSLPRKSEKDKAKTAFLESRGYRVERVMNYEIRGGASKEVADRALRYQQYLRAHSKRLAP